MMPENKTLIGFLQLRNPKDPQISSSKAKSGPVVHRFYAKMTPRLQRWAVPKYMFKGTTFPVFVSGSGYVMTKKVAECILEKSKVSNCLSLR